MAGEPKGSLDEHAPSWVTVGRSTVQGICDDLVAAVGQLVRGLALTAVALPARDSQPGMVWGDLRGKALDTVSLSDCGILEAASLGAGAPVCDAIKQSLAAKLGLAVVKAIPLDTPETHIGLLVVGWDSVGPLAGDLVRLSGVSRQAALAITNLTLRQQLARAERLKRDAEALVGAAADLASCQNPDMLYSKIVSYARDLAGAQLAYLALYDPDHHDLVVVTTTGERSSLWAGMRIPLDEGIAAQAVRERSTLVTPDLMTDARRRPAWEGVRLAEDIHGSIWVPVLSGERLLGLLQVANRHVTEFTEDDVRLLQRLASVAAAVVQNSQEREQQNHAALELQRVSQANLARCSEAQHQASVMGALAAALGSGKGMEALAASLSKGLGRLVLVCDTSRRILARGAANGATVPEVDQALASSLADPQSSLSLALGKLHAAAKPRRVAAPGHEGGSVSCVAVALAARETVTGYLLVEWPGSPPEATLALLERAAPFFAAELLRRGQLSRAQEELGADLLLDLLSGWDEEHCADQARLLGCSFEAPHEVAVIHSGADMPGHGTAHFDADGEAILAAVRAEVQSPCWPEEATLSAFHGGLAIVVAAWNPEANPWRDLHAGLTARFPDHPITLSVSEAFGGLAGIVPAYGHCLSVVRASVHLGRTGRVVSSEELGVYRLLGKLEHEDLVAFARGVLGGLLGEQPSRRADLLLTLDAYLRHSCRLHQTAEALFVHPHTLRYRINRIEEILGHGLDDPAWREEAQLALSIARVELPGLFESR